MNTILFRPNWANPVPTASFFTAPYCGWAIRTPKGNLQFSFKGFLPGSALTPEERALGFTAWLSRLMLRHGPVQRVLTVQESHQPDATWNIDPDLSRWLDGHSITIAVPVVHVEQVEIEQHFDIRHSTRRGRHRQLLDRLWAEHRIHAKCDSAAVAVAALLLEEASV